ncbi:MAG: rod shape-determining protein MreC [bacterium]|nr:rod shape-determining protein MreC [bacterium]
MGRESVLKSLPHFLLLVLISLVFLFLENFGWVKPIHAVAEWGTKPVKLVFYHSGQQLRGNFYFLTFWRTGEKKIRSLKDRNQELLVEAEKARVLEEENRALRAQLGITLPADWELELAQTLGKTRYMAIDKGEKEGIYLGQVAIVKKFLVGRVVKVNPHESQIELPSDPESKIPIMTVKTQARGLLTGQFGRGMNLEKVTQGESLETEDLVVTTGEDGYPKDLIVGKISWIEKKENEVFQKAGVEPALDFDGLEVVFLIKT